MDDILVKVVEVELTTNGNRGVDTIYLYVLSWFDKSWIKPTASKMLIFGRL